MQGALARFFAQRREAARIGTRRRAEIGRGAARGIGASAADDEHGKSLGEPLRWSFESQMNSTVCAGPVVARVATARRAGPPPLVARAIFGRDATSRWRTFRRDHSRRSPPRSTTSRPADDLATLLDRAGDILDRPGVPPGRSRSSSQRATLNAFKGAPSAYQAASDVAFGAPPSAATTLRLRLRVATPRRRPRAWTRSAPSSANLPRAWARTCATSSAAVVEAERCARPPRKSRTPNWLNIRQTPPRVLARRAKGWRILQIPLRPGSRTTSRQARRDRSARRRGPRAVHHSVARRAPPRTGHRATPIRGRAPRGDPRRRRRRRRSTRRSTREGGESAPPPSTRPPRPYPGGATPTSPTTSTTPSPCSFRTLGVCPSGRSPLRVGPPPGKAAPDGRRVDRAQYPSFRAGSTRRRRRT